MITLVLDIFHVWSILKVGCDRFFPESVSCLPVIILLFLDGIPEMFDGAEVNEAEVLAWISKELSTNEVKPTFVRTTSLISIDVVDYFLAWSKLLFQNY